MLEITEKTERNTDETQAMAPTVSIESVAIVRPIKVVAVLCGIIAIFFNGLSIAATAWLKADGKREGLWEICYYTEPSIVECERNPSRDWLHACRTMCILSLIACFIGITMATIGLQTGNFRLKYRYYMLSMIIMVLAAIPEIISLVVFPVKFLEEINRKEIVSWEIGWAYGIGWGASIFMLGSAILLYFDRGSEEVMYREKTCYYNQDSIEEAIIDG